MASQETKVIGIDPAPSKKSTVFDGKEFRDMDFMELNTYIKHDLPKDHDRILICWDAPLMDQDFIESDPKDKEGNSKTPYYRSIEEKLKDDLYDGNSKDHGASVLAYAGCSHWTISRVLFGLPRIGPYDKEMKDLPYKLLTNEDVSNTDLNDRGMHEHSIVEVHPAVAMYYWLKKKGQKLEEYKGNNKKAKENWEKLKEALPKEYSNYDLESMMKQSSRKEFGDDELDAFVAWLLGKMWLEGSGKVNLKGDEQGSAMLLPEGNPL